LTSAFFGWELARSTKNPEIKRNCFQLQSLLDEDDDSTGGQASENQSEAVSEADDSVGMDVN
jgi:hypothetical protein